MKKLLLALLIVSVMLTACEEPEKIETEIVTQTQKVTTVETVKETTAEETIVETTELTTSQNLTDLMDKYQNIPQEWKELEWTEDIIFDSVEEVKEYIESENKKLNTKINFIFTGEEEINVNDIVSGFERGIADCEYEAYDLGEAFDLKAIYSIINIKYMPSSSVIYAYQNNDTSVLEGESLQLYNDTVDFIENKLDKNASDLEKELQIHDFICESTVYFTDDNAETNMYYMPYFRNAVGALNVGQANCMGYTDAFYMLSTMAGFEVYKITSTEDMNHAWNVIVIDGKKYVVDVTWNDAHLNGETNSYIYFNAGKDVISQEYHWEQDNKIMNEVIEKTDEKFFYEEFGYLAETGEEFYQKVNELLSNGETEILIACKNRVANNTEEMMNRIFDEMNNSVAFSCTMENVGNYSFAYIELN